MEVTTISQFVTTVGFPIAAYCALFWRMMKEDEQHETEMNKMIVALNNNTIALTKLSERMGIENTATADGGVDVGNA